ncbi:hypothetical protein CF326_g9541, partial [Tilletia indica]
MRRVVVDEAHVLIDETFRSTLGDFAKLTERLSSKQFVFLSATIPPDREYELERVTCLPIRFLRDATHRPNLAYSLVKVNNFKTAVTHIKATATVTAPGSHADNQVLVICRTKMLAREVAALLGAALFYSESEANPREREEMLKGLQQWLQGLTRILVGTVAASVGIDRPHVRLVAFLDEPYSLSSFVQAAGRAGRDGLPADVVLFKMREVTGPLPKGPHPRTDDEAVALLLAGERCMREPVTEWMDGRVASCLELGGEWCSVCREMYDEHPPVMTTSATRAVALGERKEGKRKLEDTEDQHISPTPRLVVPGFVYQNGSYEISGSVKRPKVLEHVSAIGTVPALSSPFPSGSASLSRPASLVRRSPIKTIKPQHVVFSPSKARTSPSVTSSGSSTSVPPDSSPSVRRGGSSSLRPLSSMTSAVVASREWASDPVSKPERPGPMPSTGYTVRD